MIPGPSGFEQNISKKAVALLKDYMDDAYMDRYGNAVGVRLCGKANAKKLLFDAHLDEVGLIITGIEDGFLRFQAIGGVDPRVLPNQTVCILSDPMQYGVIACLPPHIQSASDHNEAIALEDLWIDLGMSQEKALKAVPIGTPVVYQSTFSELRNGYLAGKSLDDRAGFVSLLYTAELLQGKTLDVDLYIMGSTREEVGGSGAAVGTFALNPDYCIAVDVTHGRTPDAPKDETFLLGKGPVIGIGPNMTRWITNSIIDKAEALELEWQPEVMPGNSGTNAWKMQVTREGVATAVVSIPLKYMHTPYEVIKGSDIELTAQLLSAFAEGLAEEGRCSS
jgi:endoglucanase